MKTPSHLLFVLIVGLVGVAFSSLFFGEFWVGPDQMAAWIFGTGDDLSKTILSQIRLPRIVLAAMTGFSLGLAGAATQGLLRNPLAEPGLLGASNMAALGAVLVIYLGLTGTLSYLVPVAAIFGAMASVVLLLLFAGHGVSSLRLILAGFAVSTLAGAGIALALNLSPNMFAALEISFWLLGAVENRSWAHIILALPGVFIGCVLMLRVGRALDALTLGEGVAHSLGVDLSRLRLMLTVGLSLAVGSVVAVTGIIGFVGLLAPHLVRPFSGYLPSHTLLPSALLGAILLVLADSVVRIVPGQNELKLGVMTAFLGAPMLVYLLRRGAFSQERL